MLSQTAEYALRALVFLAREPMRERSVKEIAEATQVPSSYLSKVMTGLARADLISGRRGLNGGYSLKGEPSRITMFDIVQAVDPIRIIEHCPLGESCHIPSLCPMHRHLRCATIDFANRLREATIESLCDRELDEVTR